MGCKGRKSRSGVQGQSPVRKSSGRIPQKLKQNVKLVNKKFNVFLYRQLIGFNE